jgi:hypothetical protein
MRDLPNEVSGPMELFCCSFVQNGLLEVILNGSIVLCRYGGIFRGLKASYSDMFVF